MEISGSIIASQSRTLRKVILTNSSLNCYNIDFSYSSNLTKIIFPDTIDSANGSFNGPTFNSVKYITNIAMPNGLVQFGHSAFTGVISNDLVIDLRKCATVPVIQDGMEMGEFSEYYYNNLFGEHSGGTIPTNLKIVIKDDLYDGYLAATSEMGNLCWEKYKSYLVLESNYVE